jgi:hypothetical protein
MNYVTFSYSELHEIGTEKDKGQRRTIGSEMQTA